MIFFRFEFRRIYSRTNAAGRVEKFWVKKVQVLLSGISADPLTDNMEMDEFNCLPEYFRFARFLNLLGHQVSPGITYEDFNEVIVRISKN